MVNLNQSKLNQNQSKEYFIDGQLKKLKSIVIMGVKYKYNIKYI